MKYLLLLFFSLSAFAMGDNFCNQQRFKLIAIDGSDNVTLFDGGNRIDLQGQVIYRKDSPAVAAFRSELPPYHTWKLPRYTAVHTPGTDQFILNFVTHDNNGVCKINAVNEEEIQAQEYQF